jgi:hypothetical protein
MVLPVQTDLVPGHFATAVVVRSVGLAVVATVAAVVGREQPLPVYGVLRQPSFQLVVSAILVVVVATVVVAYVAILLGAVALLQLAYLRLSSGAPLLLFVSALALTFFFLPLLVFASQILAVEAVVAVAVECVQLSYVCAPLLFVFAVHPLERSVFLPVGQQKPEVAPIRSELPK